MASLLHNLLLDLRRRGNCVLKELAALEDSLPVDFNTHRAEVVERLTRALAVVDRTLSDPDLADPVLEPNFFIDLSGFRNSSSTWRIRLSSSSSDVRRKIGFCRRSFNRFAARSATKIPHHFVAP